MIWMRRSSSSMVVFHLQRTLISTGRSCTEAAAGFSSVAISKPLFSTQMRDLSSGSLLRSGIASIFAGEFRIMSSIEGVPDGFGKSNRGVRMMGGGPRTFPGGVSKWQWKRMQEKKERQIEKARLLRERQAFEERRRQEVLAAAPEVEKPWERPSFRRNALAVPSAALDPRVRALADRFRKEKAEDLWNEADGPLVATGLPTLVSARFQPRPSGGTSFDSRPSVKMSSRSQLNASLQDASHSEQRAERFQGRASETAEGSNSMNGSRRGKTGITDESRKGNGGILEGRIRGKQEGGQSGLRGKLDNLRISRNLSSSSGSASWEEFDDVESSGNRFPQNTLTRSGSGKRIAEEPQKKMENTLKKVRQDTFADTDESGEEVGEEKTASLSHLSNTRFDSFAISPMSVRALHEVMGYERMTKVQEATFPLILEGKDVLAKAKTGTGKTIAFLLPAIEAILKSRSSRDSGLLGRSPINVLIICPTRELASQAATESKTLMTYQKEMDAQIVIGGTNVNTESNNLKRRPCQILVATPGRLLDHMSSSEFRHQISYLKVLVLDEADRLLDMGFRRDLEKIIKMLPANRQTLLFSATIPNEVHKVSEVAMKKNHVFVDTVGKDTEDTHAKVQQKYAIVPLENQLGSIYTILEEHMAEEEDYKVLVFCTTARCTALMAELSTKLGFNTLEIHSRKSQAYRTRVSDTFRKSLGVIMYTSDVSARGVDYPDVTLVIQLGIPAGREEYVHRLGRTGRAGKEGRGVLILAPWEQQFLRALKDIPISEYTDLKVSDTVAENVESALDIVLEDTKEKAYQAWLGYYNSAKMLNLSKTELVKLANFFSYTLGMDEPPALLKKTIGMMGLRGVPGLRTQ